jgi:hypothetical protein
MRSKRSDFFGRRWPKKSGWDAQQAIRLFWQALAKKVGLGCAAGDPTFMAGAGQKSRVRMRSRRARGDRCLNSRRFSQAGSATKKDDRASLAEQSVSCYHLIDAAASCVACGFEPSRAADVTQVGGRCRCVTRGANARVGEGRRRSDFFGQRRAMGDPTFLAGAGQRSRVGMRSR